MSDLDPVMMSNFGDGGGSVGAGRVVATAWSVQNIGNSPRLRPSSIRRKVSPRLDPSLSYIHRSTRVAESQTIEDFGAALHLMRADLEHLRSVFLAVENGDLGMLKSLGIKDSELGDVKFFLEKLVNTGFLD